MSRLSTTITDSPALHVGFGGNHYVVCSRRLPLLEIATALGRSAAGVYWSDKHQCWAMRIRLAMDKARVRQRIIAKARGEQA